MTTKHHFLMWLKLVLNFSVAFFQLLKPYVSKGFIGIFVECNKPMQTVGTVSAVYEVTRFWPIFAKLRI